MHSSSGKLPKDETTCEELATQEERSNGGELPKDEPTSEQPETQEKH